MRNNEAAEGDLIVTDFQQKGRGQRGNAWVSERGKNLLFSILLKPAFLKASEAFLLNIMVGLALRKALLHYLPEKTIELKWPNDLYVTDCKIAGILIETSLEGAWIDTAIVGVGLNVNQSHFALQHATSVAQERGDTVDRQELLEAVLLHMETAYLALRSGQKGPLLQEYHRFLRWKGEPRIFKRDREEFEGVILGINGHGNLVVNVKGIPETFSLKEIEFVR